jgi:hypothetical protein
MAKNLATNPAAAKGAVEATHTALGVGLHLPNGLALLGDIGAILLAYKMGNLPGLIVAGKKLLTDLGINIPDPTPNDHPAPAGK